MTAEKIVLAGTLVVSSAETQGFALAVNAPTVQMTGLNLQAPGIVGRIVDLLDDNLSATLQKVATKAAETGLAPLLNNALSTLTGPRRFDVLGKTLDLQAAPSGIAFTRDGALVTLNLQASIAGTAASYIHIPTGTPAIDVRDGIQLGLSENLLNGMLAQVHAFGLLDLHVEQDYGVFDTIDLHLAMPPMVSANNPDGTLRLMLGDMIATVSDNGNPIVSAAVNAQADLAVGRGSTPEEIALAFGEVKLWLNLLESPADDGGAPGGPGSMEYELQNVAGAGLGVQLESLGELLFTLPTPSVAGVTFDNFAMHADSGYVVVSGQMH
jgi:hypothetical protein